MLCLSRWTVGVTPWSAFWQLPLILLLAVLSWRFLEEPLRRRRWWPQRWKVVATGLLLAALGAGALQGLTRYGSARLYRGDGEAGYRDPALLPPPAGALADCSAPGQAVLLLAGDSHAHHFQAAAAALCRRQGLSYDEAATVGAPYPPLHYTNPATGIDQESSLRYALVAEERFNRLLLNHPPPPEGRPSVVVLSLRSPLYFDPAYLGNAVLGRTVYFNPLSGEPVPRREALQAWIAAVRDLAARYPAGRFVVMLPTPEFGGEVPMELCRPQWFRPSLPPACREGQERAGLDRFSAMFAAELRTAVAGLPNVLLHNPALSLCGPQHCPRLRDGALLYADGDHLTAYGAAVVLDGLVADLRRRGWLPPVAAKASMSQGQPSPPAAPLSRRDP